MSPDLNRTPKALLAISGLLVAFDLYVFILNPVPRALGAALTNLALLYLVLCGNRWATYITAALLAFVAVDAIFSFFDMTNNWAGLLNGVLSGTACIYFLSPPMHKFLERK